MTPSAGAHSLSLYRRVRDVARVEMSRSKESWGIVVVARRQYSCSRAWLTLAISPRSATWLCTRTEPLMTCQPTCTSEALKYGCRFGQNGPMGARVPGVCMRSSISDSCEADLHARERQSLASNQIDQALLQSKRPSLTRLRQRTRLLDVWRWGRGKSRKGNRFH